MHTHEPTPVAASNTPLRLIRLPEVTNRIGISRSEVYRRIHNDPAFPKPATLGARCVAWVESEVDAYLLQQVEKRNARSSA